MVERTRRRLSPQRLFAFVAGAVYVVLGVCGLFAGGHHVWVFGGSLLVATLRTVAGVAGLAASRREPAARGYAWGTFLYFAALTVIGVLVAVLGSAGDAGDLHLIDWADNILHGVTAVAALGVVAIPDRVHEQRG
jgi:drug/metabolite transporter (DMT)-like permease